MGFDLYGLSPIEHSSLDEDAFKFQDEDGWARFDMMNDKDKDRYFAAQDKYHESNPGVYFRNNVWWWRPLWEFVCTSCDDILTENDMVKGSSNDGKAISKTKAKMIGKRLSKLIADGTVDELHKKDALRMAKAEIHNKEVSDKMTEISKACKKEHGANLVPANFPEPYKSEWDEVRKMEDWSGHYPFNRDNVERFAKFCLQSGGFEIC